MKVFSIVVALALAGLFFWGVSYVMAPNGGDAEFQKMLDATEHVTSFRGAYVPGTASVDRSEKLWEVDCGRNVVYKRTQTSQSDANPLQVTEDQLLVGIDRYSHNSDGSWSETTDHHVMFSGKWYCDNLAQGTLRDLLPDTRAMLRSAMIGKAEKKTVNGVRCQDWQFAMKSATNATHGTVCIGPDDHLPYEMILDSGAHYSYSNYNQSIEVAVPEDILQRASASGGN